MSGRVVGCKCFRAGGGGIDASDHAAFTMLANKAVVVDGIGVLDGDDPGEGGVLDKARIESAAISRRSARGAEVALSDRVAALGELKLDSVAGRRGDVVGSVYQSRAGHRDDMVGALDKSQRGDEKQRTSDGRHGGSVNERYR